MEDKDPFGYPLLTYAAVIGLACAGGMVRHLNNMREFSLGSFIIDAFSAGFTGLVAFWLCQWGNISGPGMAVAVATTGLMGNRAWKELENVWRARLSLPPVKDWGPPDDPHQPTMVIPNQPVLNQNPVPVPSQSVMQAPMPIDPVVLPPVVEIDEGRPK